MSKGKIRVIGKIKNWNLNTPVTGIYDTIAEVELPISEEDIREFYQANMLDGDSVDDCGDGMVNAKEVWEFIKKDLIPFLSNNESKEEKSCESCWTNCSDMGQFTVCKQNNHLYWRSKAEKPKQPPKVDWEVMTSFKADAGVAFKKLVDIVREHIEKN